MFLSEIIRAFRTNFFLSSFKEKGKNINIHFPVTIKGKHNVSVGDNVAIGTYVHIWGSGGVRIGSDVLIASHCCITSLGHNLSRKLLREETVSSPVILEDDVWLGYNVTVLPGVTIGTGSVIGAGSVVTSNIPPYSIAVGNPAKVIKKRIIAE